ncbi:hypothetical protein QLX08_005678 [Tetragonisca angustula]|uniref:Uncharacterized protein n=1 Tax=Tetragonisca angustula TaxID=166442 RepID=A0AAW0ZXB2_9HYME
MTTDVIAPLRRTTFEKSGAGSDRGLEASPFTAGTSIESGGEPPSLCLSLSLPDRPLWPTDESNRQRTERRGKPERRTRFAATKKERTDRKLDRARFAELSRSKAVQQRGGS